MSGELLFSSDGPGLIIQMPDDPFFLESRWSSVSWGKPPPVELGGPAPQGPAPQGPQRERPVAKAAGPSSEVRVSKPVAATLTSDDAEGDLRAFIRDQQATFDIVHFACGFKPARGERIETATLEIYLYGQRVLMSDGQHRKIFPMESSDPDDYPDPIAWSMQPLIRSGGSGDRTTTVRVGANLKFVNVGIDHSRRSKDQACIQARGELTSNPNWTIKRTRVYTLDCDERFALIVRREQRARLYMWLDLRVNGRYRGIFGGRFSGEANSSLYVDN